MAFATTVSFGPSHATGFVGPEFEDNTYTPCNVGDIGCVQGDASAFALYGVQLTSPSSGNIWTLTIELNYAMCKPGTSGCSLSGTIIPGSVIPPGQWSDGSYNSISDFLINWNNQDYAVVLAPHIQAGSSVASYVAGNLYQAPNTQFDEVYSGIPNDFGAPGVLTGSPERDLPVWIAAGGALLGAGTVSVALGGNGTPAMYTITDQFSAPDGFLATGDFTAIASTYPCANGIGAGTGSFAGGNMGGVPEPGTFVLVAPALVLFWFGRRLFRERRLL